MMATTLNPPYFGVSKMASAGFSGDWLEKHGEDPCQLLGPLSFFATPHEAMNNSCCFVVLLVEAPLLRSS